MTDIVSMLDAVPLDQLEPDPQNAKIHTDFQIAQLAEGIKELGFNDPIGVVTRGNKFLIVEGEGRWRAARLLGLPSVPVLLLDHLSDRERKAYAITHNKDQLLSGLDMDEVGREFQRLEVKETEFPTLGFIAEDVLFINAAQSDILNDESIAATGKDNATWQNFIPPVLMSKVRFDDEQQFQQWVGFIDRLREMYPDEPMISARVMRFIREYGSEFCAGG
jgi:hypothetical protein